MEFELYINIGTVKVLLYYFNSCLKLEILVFTIFSFIQIFVKTSVQSGRSVESTTKESQPVSARNAPLRNHSLIVVSMIINILVQFSQCMFEFKITESCIQGCNNILYNL